MEGGTVMNVLIAVASKHGGTNGIANIVADELQRMGFHFTVEDVDDVSSVEPYDAVIVGSAVYMGKWLPEAEQFAHRFTLELAKVPVWLFSSGPIGKGDPQPHGDPAGIDDIIHETSARGHKIFVGRLEKDQLGLKERLITLAIRAPQGDFREWEVIRAWAREIGRELQSATVTTG
jgi:menaquinone-dependent protoporphyrinogen oxidase